MIGERSGELFSLMGKTPTGRWLGCVRGWCLSYTLVLVYVFYENSCQHFHITQLNSSLILFLFFLTNKCPWLWTSYLVCKCLASQLWRILVNLILSPPCFCQISRPWLAFLFFINVWVYYDSIFCKEFLPGIYFGWLCGSGDGLSMAGITLICTLTLADFFVNNVYCLLMCIHG